MLVSSSEGFWRDGLFTAILLSWGALMLAAGSIVGQLSSRSIGDHEGGLAVWVEKKVNQFSRNHLGFASPGNFGAKGGPCWCQILGGAVWLAESPIVDRMAQAPAMRQGARRFGQFPVNSN